MRRHALRERGFTLMEIILAMIVGALVIGSATVAYTQMRENASATAARARAAALASLVERLTSESGGAVPGADRVRAAWLASRNDANSSPWGGKAVCSNGDCGPAACSGDDCAGIRDLPITCINANADRCFHPDDAARGDSGVMVYAHYLDPRPNASASALSVWDHSQKLYVRTGPYFTAAVNPSGREFYFVHGLQVHDDAGRPMTPTDVRPGDSDCGCPEQAGPPGAFGGGYK